MLKTLTSWFRSPVFPDDADKTRSAFLLNVVLNSFLLILPVLFINSILGGHLPTPRRYTTQVIVFVCWLIVLGLQSMIRKGYVKAAGITLVSIGFIGTTSMVFNLGTIRAPAVSFYFLAIVMAGLTIGRKAIIWMVAINSISIFALLTAEENGWLAEPTLAVSITQGVTFIITFVVLGILLFLSVKSIDEALSHAQQELTNRIKTDEALQQTNARLEVMHEIDRALLSAQSLHDIAKATLIRIRKLIPCERASVTLFNFQTKEAMFLAADFDGMESIPDTPIWIKEYGMEVIEQLQQNKPWFTDDILQESEVTDLDKRLVNEHGIKIWLSLPLLYQGQLIGALNLGRVAGNPFSQEDAQIAHDIANQLAIALQQTNLYNALQSELLEHENLIAKLEANNAELERFTYTVSHDLRNPLVTIKGFLGMLEKDLQDQRLDKVKNDFQRIAGATDKMNELLSDLLELSRIGRIINPPEEVDLSILIQDAMDTVEARLLSRHVTVNIKSDLPSIYGDRIRLREVFENLIDNAVKYMGDQSNPVIDIGTIEEDGGQIVFVKDNGMGIESGYQSKIFGLFEKLNPTIEGTGIGLALVKRIIETHGGIIWVKSDGLGKGSTFCFTLPNSREQS